MSKLNENQFNENKDAKIDAKINAQIDAKINVTTPAKIPFIDLQTQRKRLGEPLMEAVRRVIEQGNYIMGPEIHELEQKLSEFCKAKHALTCANGTDALSLILMAKGIGPMDAVFVPTFTFAATAEVVALLGATPVFVDSLPDTFNMDPNSLVKAIAYAKNQNLNPKAIITVDLFGLPSDFDAIDAIAKTENLWILSDAAQSFGAQYKGRSVGTMGLATSTSFFPAKPLGCYGDGGAIFTDNDELAQTIKSLRLHGQGKHKYDYIHIGMNGRMDTLQAAILLQKLKIFPDELIKRDNIARRYNEGLSDIVTVPHKPSHSTSTFAQYTLRLRADIRAALMQALDKVGIPTAIYYPMPLHLQPAYRKFHLGNPMPVAEELGKFVLSLPMHPYLDEKTQDWIIQEVRLAIQHCTELMANNSKVCDAV